MTKDRFVIEIKVSESVFIWEYEDITFRQKTTGQNIANMKTSPLGNAWFPCAYNCREFVGCKMAVQVMLAAARVQHQRSSCSKMYNEVYILQSMNYVENSGNDILTGRQITINQH